MLAATLAAAPFQWWWLPLIGPMASALVEAVQLVAAWPHYQLLGLEQVASDLFPMAPLQQAWVLGDLLDAGPQRQSLAVVSLELAHREEVFEELPHSCLRVHYLVGASALSQMVAACSVVASHLCPVELRLLDALACLQQPQRLPMLDKFP